MKKLLLLTCFLITVNFLTAQTGNVGINTANPDPLATLDIHAISGEGGLLIPRTDTTTINLTGGTIPSGLMIFQTTDVSFYFYNGSKWVKIGSIASALSDADKDTQIKLVESFQDRMEFSLDGVKHFEMRKNLGGTVRLNIMNNDKNIGIGKSLVSNTTGIYNVGLGDDALFNNSSGSSNTAIGTEVLLSNQSGSANTGVGYEVLYSSNGSQNTGVGYQSLVNSISGNNNTALGSFSLYGNTEGSGNVALGNNAARNEMGSNKLYIENSSADSSQALVYGEFDNDILRVNGQLQVNDPAGSNGYSLPTDRGATPEKYLITNADGTTQWKGLTESWSMFLDDSWLEFTNPTANEGLLVDLSPLTIAAQVDNLFLDSNNELILTDNSGNTRSVSLGSLSTAASIADGDADTKISVDNGSDSDNVTIDLAGTTKFLLEANQHGIATLKFNNNNFNTLVGDGAGKDLLATGAGSNTIVGRFAGSKISSGERNTFLGGGAAERNNGNLNTIVGFLAGADNLTGSGNVFLGNRAGQSEVGSNRLYIENANADSSQALIYGEFDNDILRVNGTLQVNDPAGPNGYSLPTTRGFANQFLKINADGTTEWGHDESLKIQTGFLQGNKLKLHQDILGPDTIVVDMDNVVAAGLAFSNGEEVNTGIEMRYFIYVNNSGDFPNVASNNPHNVIGELKLFAGIQASLGGWLPCEGQELDIIDYQPLFAVIGTTYGGDGMTTFNLPDLRKSVPVHN